jgi:hypothetical protein
MTGRTRHRFLLATALFTPIIVVGLVVLSHFNPPDVQTQRDHIINDLYNLSADCYHYRTSSGSTGGGDGSFVGYRISDNVKLDTLGGFSYNVVSIYADSIFFEGRCQNDQSGSVQVKLDEYGRMSNWRYFGDLETS